MTPPRERMRDNRSWPFDVGVLGLGVVLFAWVAWRVAAAGWQGDVALALVLGVPLIVVVSRFPMVLDDADSLSIEIGFDSSILMFLLCTVEPVEALAVWSAGIVATQLTSGKRAAAKSFNIGIGVLAGGVAAAVLPWVRGPVEGTPRELVAVAVAATSYFAMDYVLSAVNISIDSRTSLVRNLVQKGTLPAVACFVALDLLGYLGAVVLRYAPWWPVTILLAVPLTTLLVATRAVTRGNENARRLKALLEAAVRAQTLYDTDQVLDALQSDARELLRLRDVSLREAPPEDGEIGAKVVRGKRATWVVAPARSRARSTMLADQQALDALAVVASDAFARLQLTDSMVHYARHDPLTDLPNRGILQDRTTHALQLAGRRGSSLALVLLDLDGFKPVNDRFGHAAGDRVLVEVADRLRACTRESDTIARLGGDEFAVLFEDVTHDDALQLGGRILAAIAEGVVVSGTPMPLSASIGVAFNDDESTTERILRHADLAMYEAKARGKGRVVEYERAMGASRLEKLELIEALRYAVRQRQIGVVYQPVVEASSGRIEGVEALARWRWDDQDVPPDVFIPLAEEVGLICELGEVVLAQAAQDAVTMQGAAGRLVTMSVNVSAQQLRDPRFLDVVRDAVRVMGHIQLVLEITEREGVGGDPVAIATMESINALGVLFAIDDFGIGFSSFGYLQDVPAQIIKSDAALSRNIDTDARACLLLRSIATMGRELGMEVVVEGIERASQLELIREQVHAPLAQGYLMHRPMPLDRLVEVMSPEDEVEVGGEVAADAPRSGAGATAVEAVPARDVGITAVPAAGPVPVAEPDPAPEPALELTGT